MPADDRSAELFGRYQALRIYAAIARHPTVHFTTGEIARAVQAPTADLSKELRRLARLGLVRSNSRRGDYERVDDTVFWRFVEALDVEWGNPGMAVGNPVRNDPGGPRWHGLDDSPRTG